MLRFYFEQQKSDNKPEKLMPNSVRLEVFPSTLIRTIYRNQCPFKNIKSPLKTRNTGEKFYLPFKRSLF